MAQKAAKTLAARNTSLLRQTHITTACLHAIFLLLHFLIRRPRSLLPYAIFTLPTLLIEFYFERLGRPRYNPSDKSLRSPGEDLDAPGLTEYFWDVLYWTWGCMGAVCVFGDRAWWLWIVVPLYSAWSAYTTFLGVRKGFAGMGTDENDQAPVAESKRQKKLEKRGQRVKYR
ncbi:hypothetical protein PRK78_003309 [Emydomyces testavorans]|uniref:DUF788 domain protein n=1 Tax=Emydomyces testavorans TaxID=2070801 RepID=A0AAF0DFY9_9EURO|nr:hypothetical protein PRK78_003309 [Emydomyces testavorans]